MPRAPTTLDAFNAVAEPKRRRVLELLAGGERPVNDIVDSLGWPQPMISKHLAVLKHVGLVSVRRLGRQRLYGVRPERLKPIHDWTGSFERFWTHQLDRVKQRAEEKMKSMSSGRKPHNEQER